MVERLMGVEPTWPAWEAGALPLSYRRSALLANADAACQRSLADGVGFGPTVDLRRRLFSRPLR